jgi:hypothetical protein
MSGLGAVVVERERDVAKQPIWIRQRGISQDILSLATGDHSPSLYPRINRYIAENMEILKYRKVQEAGIHSAFY